MRPSDGILLHQCIGHKEGGGGEAEPPSGLTSGPFPFTLLRSERMNASGGRSKQTGCTNRGPRPQTSRSTSESATLEKAQPGRLRHSKTAQEEEEDGSKPQGLILKF